MESMSVSSCRCCMFVSCVHPVAVLNAAFCILHDLQFVDAGRGCKRQPYRQVDQNIELKQHQNATSSLSELYVWRPENIYQEGVNSLYSRSHDFPSSALPSVQSVCSHHLWSYRLIGYIDTVLGMLLIMSLIRL